MNNIEKLAPVIMGTNIQKLGQRLANMLDCDQFNNIVEYLDAINAELQAKALQSSEPVAEAVRERDKLGHTVVNVIKKLDEISELTQEIELDDIIQVAIPMDDWAALQDALDGMTERANTFTHHPASVPLEKYNKLLDALNRIANPAVINNYNDAQTYRNIAKQAIAEAEGKEG